MTKTLALLATLGFAALATAHTAEARPVKCLLIVDGATYINQTCDFRAVGDEGSFTISTRDYFAQVSVESPGVASGYWNEEKGAGHAHSYLGTLTRNGACWNNERTTLCAF